MSTFAQLINKAASISTHAEKHAVLKQITDTEMLKWALDYTKVFGVKAFEYGPEFSDVDAGFDSFYQLCENLTNRIHTGNDARSAIKECLKSYTKETADVLAQVLKKDLKCGASINTFRELFPSLNLPRFELMGAGKVDDKTKPVYPCIGEVKYDGNRMIAYSHNQSFWSRKGLPHVLGEGFESDVAELESVLSTMLPHKHFVFDGETYGDNFSETQQAKGKNSVDQKQKVKYYVFDFMPYTDWVNESCVMTQETRTAIIREAISKLSNENKIRNATMRILNNEQEATEFYKEALALGFEGLILKDQKGLYQWNMTSGGRGKEWLKWKPVIDVDLTIVGFELGQGKNKDKLGKFLVEGHDENGNVITSGVGGFKVSLDTFMDSLSNIIEFDKNKLPKNKDQWFRSIAIEQYEKFYGRVVKIEAQELSKSKNNSEFSLRFPYIVEFRNDK